jgi:hypothetical protein
MKKIKRKSSPCVFITAVPVRVCVGKQWRTCATRDYEPYYKAVRVGDMCYERLRAEACVD